MSSLKDIIISRTRVEVLEAFFSRPDKPMYVRELTRFIKGEINSVRRELERLLACGLLKSDERGNRIYYLLNDRYLFFQEIQQMIVKCVGLGLKIRKFRRKLGELHFVMFSGRFARKLSPLRDEVDMLIVGDVVLPELEVLIKEEQAQLGRELNYAVFSTDEFEFRKTRRDPFVMEILYNSRVMIIGSEDELVKRTVPGLASPV